MLKILTLAMRLLVSSIVLSACTTTDENLRDSRILLPNAPDWGWLDAQPRCENREVNLATQCPPWQVCVIEERYNLWCTP